MRGTAIIFPGAVVRKKPILGYHFEVRDKLQAVSKTQTTRDKAQPKRADRYVNSWVLRWHGCRSGNVYPSWEEGRVGALATCQAGTEEGRPAVGMPERFISAMRRRWLRRKR